MGLMTFNDTKADSPLLTAVQLSAFERVRMSEKFKEEK